MPIPGHSVAQVGVVVAGGDRPLFFVADHMLRADWFEEDYAAGRHLGLGIFFPGVARETSRRIHEFVHETGARPGPVARRGARRRACATPRLSGRA